MWLAKEIYEPLPVIYMLAGVVAVGFGLYTESLVVQVVLTLPGVTAVVGGLVLLLKRRAYRRSRSRDPYNEIS